MDSIRRRRIYADERTTRRAGGPGTTEPGIQPRRRSREEVIESINRTREMRIKGPLIRKIQQELGSLSIEQLQLLSQSLNTLKESPDA